jgi:Cd2+/Zn2+-exporting ATPase
MGVQARSNGYEMMLGRPQLLVSQGVNLSDEIGAQGDAQTDAGRSFILMALNRQAAGVLVLEDELRPEAKPTLARLQQMGIRTVLVSGDHRETVERIGAMLGVDAVYAEVLPQDKVSIVKRLQSEGRRVAFVGDGVNDGPALAAADVGVAMGVAGTDVAIETAEIALLSDDLARLPHLLDLSRQALRAIRQNLVFSIGVLMVAVGLTVVGILTPVTGALLHELSSIPVIANSARLIGMREQTR